MSAGVYDLFSDGHETPESLSTNIHLQLKSEMRKKLIQNQRTDILLFLIPWKQERTKPLCSFIEGLAGLFVCLWVFEHVSGTVHTKKEIWIVDMIESIYLTI